MKPPPVTVAADIVKLDPPVFDKVRACVWLLPTLTLPKLIEPGVTLSVPIAPVPLREITRVGFAAFDAIARLAVIVPDVVGENVTDRFALAPAASE